VTVPDFTGFCRLPPFIRYQFAGTPVSALIRSRQAERGWRMT
jgi:hypothetical protein